MNRKEMILAAVLVNAGLLIVLFATALKTDTEGSTSLVKDAKVIEKASELVAKNQDPVIVGGEVDRALQTLASVNQPLASPGISADEIGTGVPSFVDEIKSIAHSETPSSAPVAPVVQTLVAPLHKEGSRMVEVKVKKGDVLEKIARHNHSTVQEIMKANQLTSSNLRIGQVLKVPQKEGGSVIAATSIPVTPAHREESSAKWYEVKKGDSPWTIAVKNHVKVEDLLRLNQMTEEQARRLKPGDKIRIQ